MTAAPEVIKLLGRLPLAARRHALRTLWRATLAFRAEVGFGLEPVVGRYLKVGAGAARRIALEHDFQDSLLIMEWCASICRTKQQMIDDTRNARVNDATLVQRVADSGDAVILAPMHMGVFPVGISTLLWRYFAGRRLLVLRAREDLPEHNLAMDRLREIAGEFRILNTRNEADFVDAMRFVRKGGVVVSLLDLPESYGSPADTTLFGEPAAIALGLDALSRMLKAVVLPMTVKSLLSHDEILLGRPFQVSESGAEERRSLAQAIGRQVEEFVKLAPAQWHMWTRMSEFYPERLWIRTPPAPRDAARADAHVGF